MEEKWVHLFGFVFSSPFCFVLFVYTGQWQIRGINQRPYWNSCKLQAGSHSKPPKAGCAMLEELMMKNQILSWSRLTELGWNPWVLLIYSSSECGLKCLIIPLCLHFEVISADFLMVLSPIDVFVGCQEPSRSPASADGGAWKSTRSFSWEKLFLRILE